MTEVAAEREVKSAIASAEEIIGTSSDNQPDVQPDDQQETSSDVQPEASEQVNEEIPLVDEECSSAVLNDVKAPSGQFSNFYPLCLVFNANSVGIYFGNQKSSLSTK